MPRATFDIDVLVDADDVGLQRCLRRLEANGFGVEAAYLAGWRDQVRDMPLVKALMFRDGRSIASDLFPVVTPLQRSAVQRITWRNHVAGRCLPFAQCMGGGTLGQVFLSSLLGSAAVGGGVLLLVHLRQRGALPPWPLGLAWLADALMLLFLATSQTRRYRRGAPTQQRGRWLYLFVMVQIVVSVALHLAGHSWTATIVAGAPQVVVFTSSVLYLLAAMTAGRNARRH